MGFKPDPKKWSKKEILGHLIDSAANNDQRFVRAVNKVAVQFPTYDQDDWVRIQRYNGMSWSFLFTLEFVVKDDLRHLQHHLKDILEEQA